MSRAEHRRAQRRTKARALFVWNGIDLPMPRLTSKQNGGELDESMVCNAPAPEGPGYKCTRDVAHAGSHAALDDGAALVALWDPDEPPSLPPVLRPFITPTREDPALWATIFRRLIGLAMLVVIQTPQGPGEGDVVLNDVTDEGLKVAYIGFGDEDLITWDELLGVRLDVEVERGFDDDSPPP